MPITLDQLPDDIAELKRLVLAKDAELLAQSSELAAAKNGLVVSTLTIERLKAQLAKLRREKFGSNSERIERAIEQLELALEEAEAAKAEAEASVPLEPETPSPDVQPDTPEKKKRRQLPPDLPRRDVVHAPGDVCKTCGGTELRTVGESVTEVLEYIPGRFEVTRHVRPACSCRKCEAMMQAPMPELPIPRGMAGPGFLAHIAVAKFCDHLPLYRQAEIYARSGLDLDRGQLADWLGHVAWLLRPLVELIAEHVMAGRVIHADDTPVPVLAPGAGKTKTGRQWVYLRDERPHAGTAPPAVLYRYTPDRVIAERCFASTASTAGPSWPASPAGCTPAATRASASSMRSQPDDPQTRLCCKVRRVSPKLPAGRTRGAASTTSTSRTRGRSRRKRSIGSARCSTSNA